MLFKAMISSDWVINTDLELPTIKTLWATRKSSAVVWRARTPNFYRVHQTILRPSINSNGSKDHPHISPSTGYYKSLKIKKEIIILNSIKIITYKIKWLNEQTQSVECGCQRTVAPFFGGLDSVRMSLQTTPLGSTYIQET